MAESGDRNLPFSFKNFRERVAESEKAIPKISFDDFDIRVDKDFSDFRKKFNDEIQKVEEEMARFRSELMDKDGNVLLSALMSKAGDTPQMPQCEAKQHGISSIDPPTIQKQGKRNVMKLRFDVSQFKPEEVVVSAGNEKLSVQGKCKQKLGDQSIYRESSREIRLPKGVKPNTIRSTVTKDGVLTVNAPLPDLPDLSINRG